MNVFERVHATYVHNRRAQVLRLCLAAMIPHNSRVLDVGCGDGLLDYEMIQERRDLELRGIDVLVREQTKIPVDKFDGMHIPYENASFDVVMFVDVLHHTDDPMTLLQEAVRVAQKTIVIKDHLCGSLLDKVTLRFMDKVSNQRHGVDVPGNYLSKKQWFDAFNNLNLSVSLWEERLGLYPPVANLVFGRSLHFVARLDLI